MKLCFSTLACPNWTLPQIIGAAAAHGLDGVDFRGVGTQIDVTRLSLFNEELPATLELLARHKIVIPCYQTSVALVSPAADRWEMMLDECQRYARLAEKTSTPYIRIFGGGIPKEMTRDEARSLAQRHLRQLTKVCAQHHCLPLVETHDVWIISDEILELVDGFSPDEVGILWDMEHPWRRGEAPEQTAQRIRPFLRHIHIKDSIVKEGKMTQCVLGGGELPLPRLLAALRGIDYDGWICLETEKRWHPDASPEPEQSLPQYAAYMKEHCK